VSGGELFTHLYQREHFAEDEVRIYVGEIILALEQLHKVSAFWVRASEMMSVWVRGKGGGWVDEPFCASKAKCASFVVGKRCADAHD
jgi:hypothetical protein